MAKEKEQQRPDPKDQLAVIGPPRLPYHPAIEERFGVGKAEWKALCEAIFPGATSTESIILALSYCKARRLDPFKRNVHIVPIWDKNAKRYVDTIWPGIGELRTTAFRTGDYAGRSHTVFGELIEERIGTLTITYPEFAQVTVRRIVQGHIVEFAGPAVYWKETYAPTKRDDPTPNAMWAQRPRGQIEKCAEAAALRAAFPEEIGADLIAEEAQASRGLVVEGEKVETFREGHESRARTLEDLKQKLDKLESSLPPVGVKDHVGPMPSDAELAEADKEPESDAGEDLEEFRLAIERKLARCRDVPALEKLAGELSRANKGDKEKHDIILEMVAMKDAHLDELSREGTEANT